MVTRRPLIAGNWKMNGLGADGAVLAGGLAQWWRNKPKPIAEILICPPALLVSMAAGLTGGTDIKVGGQDCHMAEAGAHTGDISAMMLKDAGCTYVIVGHSERRADHGETDAIVKAKAHAAIEAGLIPIICIGETAAQREAGRTLDVIGTQLRGSLPQGALAHNTVIAYEPVWAIGTGQVATPEQAQDVHRSIRRDLSAFLGPHAAEATRILYGGSMKPSNAQSLLSLEDVDGGLIGGASLQIGDFTAIIDAVG